MLIIYHNISPYQHDFHGDFADVVMAEDQKQQAKDDLDAAMALLDLRAGCDGTRMPWKHVGKPWKNMGKPWKNMGKPWKKGYGWKWMENMLNTMKKCETQLYYQGFSWIYHCKQMKIHSKTMTIIENCWAYLFAFRIKSSFILS